MDTTTRPATSSDREFARRAHHVAYRELVERRFGTWAEALQEDFFTASWTAAEYTLVLCDGIPCGYVCIESQEAEVHVREIVVRPEFQGRGIGSFVLQQAMEQARQRGVPVSLRTAHVNRAAVLYRRLGFREVGRTETHILFEWHPGDR